MIAIKQLGIIYYESLISGRRVNIVGGGSVKVQPEADITVHINDHYRSYMGPVDVIYSCCSTGDPAPLFRLKEVQNLKFMWLDSNSFNFLLWRKLCESHNIPHGGYARRRMARDEGDWLSDFQRLWELTPLTGVVALHHILTFKPKSVFITGMDLYYNPETNSYPARRHDFDLVKHAQYLRSLDRSVVKFDNHLDYVLFDPTVKISGLHE